MSIRITNYQLLIFIVTTLFSSFQGLSQNASVDSIKAQGVRDLREFFSENTNRDKYYKSVGETEDELLTLLNDEGLFADQLADLNEIETNNWRQDSIVDINQKIGLVYTESFSRYWKLIESYRGKELAFYIDSERFKQLSRGMIDIGKRELGRVNVNGRFHASCFAIPTCAINSYFALFDLMQAIESGEMIDPELIELNGVLRDLGMQSWTQPYRHDETDDNIVSVERFQHHVWWVGGNGLGYRSLLPCAAMINSIKMVDVLAEVASKGISVTSHTTYESSFWNEGFTADGAGWGHGKQCLIFGYPIDGTSSALNILKHLQRTPWEQKLTEENIASIFNYLKGSSYYVFKGYNQLFLSRGSFKHEPEGSPTKSLVLVKNLLKNWSSSLTADQIAELTQYQEEAKNYLLLMDDYPVNDYSGVKYFFNNDDLIKKTETYSTFINMASIRVDGTESFDLKADKQNIFTNDGATLFTKSARDYQNILGAWNPYAVPGVTNRHPSQQPYPITNWRGFCSKYNFAGGATGTSGNAMAGFKFEKMNATAKPGVNDLSGLHDPNTDLIYGLKAFKSYFLIDDYIVALGAGITNLQPEKEGEILTTINQTESIGEVMMNGKTLKIKAPSNYSKTINSKKKKELAVVEQAGHLSYAFLPEFTCGDITISIQNRPTNWLKHNQSNENSTDLPTSSDVFQLTYNHGQTPVNDTYGYIVYAGEQSGQEAFKTNPVKVLQNDTLIQAVQSADETVLGATFYTADQILDVGTYNMKVSNPAVVLLEKNTTGYSLSIVDPEMNAELKSMTFSFSMPFESTVQNGDWHELKVDLPTEELTGKPVTFQLNTK